jgi:hypothetical protein
MAMDINDFGLEHEAFGFGDTDYSQMANSNTEFLNLFGGLFDKDKRQAKRDIEALKADYYARIDALPPSANAERDALFAELEQKMKERGAQLDQIQEAKKAKSKAERGQKIVGGLEKGLDLFSKATDALGIGRTIRGEESRGGSSQGGSGQGNQGGGNRNTTATNVPTWVWITGGVVVLGLGVLAIVKFRE